MSEKVYIYDGSINGFFSCVFHSYEKKEVPINITTEDGVQTALGQTEEFITTDTDKADRVFMGFRKKAGELAEENLRKVLLSANINKEITAYHYIRLGLKVGGKIYNMLAHPHVLPVLDISVNVNNEVLHQQGFLRFSLMENGVFFSKIAPKNNIVPIMMPHLVDRYSVQPFVVYDETNKLAGVYDLKEWQLRSVENVKMPKAMEGEEYIEDLWRHFCESINIKERQNLKGQMTMCPKRFWDNMLEMQPKIVKPNSKKLGEASIMSIGEPLTLPIQS